MLPQLVFILFLFYLYFSIGTSKGGCPTASSSGHPLRIFIPQRLTALRASRFTHCHINMQILRAMLVIISSTYLTSSIALNIAHHHSNFKAYFLVMQEELPWKPGTSYLSWGGHVMYLPPAPEQPLSMMGPIDRSLPVRYV